MNEMISSKYIFSFFIFTYLITTSQTCKKVTPTSCSGVEIFYGPLVETYGPTSDGNQNQQDRFYLGNIYYTSSNTDFKALKVDFEVATVESVTGAPGISNSSSSSEILLQKSGNANLPTTGNGFAPLATVAWRLKYTDFNNVFGKQKFTFLDDSGQPFADCQPSFIRPPMLYSYNGENILEPSAGYTPPLPESYPDINISNNRVPVIICMEEGILKNQVATISECTNKHLELTYEYLNEEGIPLKILRNEVLPRELVERVLKLNKGVYNGTSWWCDNGDLITSKFCKSCGPQRACRKITFKM